jgi:hypothetical protein
MQMFMIGFAIGVFLTATTLLIVGWLISKESTTLVGTGATRPDPLATDPRANPPGKNNPYNTTLSAGEARMMAQTEERLRSLCSSAPTSDIRVQAELVLKLHIKMNVIMDEGTISQRNEIMDMVTHESNMLFAMLTDYGLEHGAVDYNDIPMEMRELLEKYRANKAASAPTMPTTQEDLEGNLDFNMPNFGKFKQDGL